MAGSLTMHFIYGVHMNGDVNAHVKGQIENYPKATNNFCVRFIYVNYASHVQVALSCPA